MPIFLYLDDPADVDDLESLTGSLRAWAEPLPGISWVDNADHPRRGGHELGIEFEPRRAADLKAPLNFLYSLARRHGCDFVVGRRDSDALEDVCYFGAEEGRPDMFEVASYLGL